MSAAAAELDLAVACSQVHRTGPRMQAPEQLWRGLSVAMLQLLGP